jgi:monoamine oxidase
MKQNSNIQTCDVAIIGAGLAGLMAARTLVAEGKNVLLLEAQNHVGGRTLNHSLAEGQALELGGQWLGPTQEKMYALCRELGLETYPTYSCGDQLVSFDGKITRLKAGDDVSSVLPTEVALEANVVLEKLATMSQSLDLETPCHHPQALEWDNQTLASWLEQHTQHPETAAYLQLELKGLFAAEASDLALLHVLFTLKSGGGFQNLVSVKNGAQQDRIVGGSGLIAERMAQALGERVILSTPVRRLEQNETRVRVITDNLVVNAERVIVTLPPTLANRLVYEPALPEMRQQLLNRSAMGSVIKVMVVYDKPFWREEGLSGQVLSSTGPINTLYDNSPHDGRYGVLLGFIEGEQARHLRCLGHGVRERLTVECLLTYFGQKALNYTQYLEKNWLTDPWAQGGYCGHFGPGLWTSYGAALRERCGRIHWAGAETSSIWNGYMEGAVCSGERAAHEILALPTRAEATVTRALHSSKNGVATSVSL